jgi:hypothetical protein
MTAMGIVLTGGLFSDWLVLRLQTKKELTIGQMFTWRIMPLVFSPVLNLLFIGSVYLSIYYEPAKPIVDSLMPLAKIVVVGPVIPMMWCIVRGIAFSSVIPGKRGSAAILLSMLIILPAAGCAMSVYISIIEAYVGQAPFFL